MILYQVKVENIVNDNKNIFQVVARDKEQAFDLLCGLLTKRLKRLVLKNIIIVNMALICEINFPQPAILMYERGV